MTHKHLGDYFSLIGILVATFVGFFVFWYDKNFQLALITAASLAYFVWGIIFHFLRKDLNIQLIIEYAVFASLGFVIGVSVVFRA